MATRTVARAWAGAPFSTSSSPVSLQSKTTDVRVDSPSSVSDNDPTAGLHNDTAAVTNPDKPIRRRLKNLHSFVTTRGGEYCFLPGLRALRWIADLRD